MESPKQTFVEAIVDAACEPVVVLDVNLRVSAASHAFYRAFRLKREECEGRPITELGNGRWDVRTMNDLLERVRHNRTRQASLILPDDPQAPECGAMRIKARRVPGAMKGDYLVVLTLEDVAGAGRSHEKTQRRRHPGDEHAQGSTCLRGVCGTAQRPGLSTDELLQEIVDIIPSAFPHSRIACARVVLGDGRFETRGCREQGQRSDASITVRRKHAGHVEVYRQQETTTADAPHCPPHEQGPASRVARLVAAALELIETERALEESGSRNRDLLVGANVAMCMCDMEGTVVEVNEVAAALTGYTVDELTGLDLSLLLTPASLRTVRRGQRLRLSRRRADGRCQLEVLKKDGTRVIVESVARLILSDGKPFAVQALVRDITQETKTQEALRESEQQYRRIVETSQEGIWVIDAQSKTVFANTKMAQMLGYSADEMHGRPLLEFMAPEQRARAEGLVERRRQGVTERHDFEFQRKDGSRLWAMVSTTPILDEHGDYAGALGMIADITERKLAQQALQRERTEVQMVLDSVPAIVFHKDREGRFVRVNRALVEASGIPEDQWLGRTVFDLFPHLAMGYHRDDQEVMASERPKRGIIERFESPGGTRWVRTDKLPFRDSHGNVVGVIGLSIDVTEQQRAEEALSASERRYHGLFDIASDAILIGNLGGDIIQANKAAVTLAGYGFHELAGMNISRLLTPESAIVAIQMWQELVEGEGDRRGEWELVNRDGVRVAADVALTLMMEEGKAAAVQAVLRDVTQLKRWRENMLFYISAKIRVREEERRRIARELHDETVQDLASLLLDIEATSRFSGGLPHEVRTHLEKARDRVETIMEGVRRISHELRPQMLDHLGLLAALEWLTEEMAVSYGIEAELKIGGTPRRLSPDTELTLFRIAQEALNNVRKTSRATEATVCIEFKADEVRLTVADNGRGFALPEMLSDFAAKGKLGLLGMHERARSLHGILSIRSEPGKGTVVSVDIPA